MIPFFICAECEDKYAEDYGAGPHTCEQTGEIYCEWCAPEHIAKCARCSSELEEDE